MTCPEYHNEKTWGEIPNDNYYTCVICFMKVKSKNCIKRHFVEHLKQTKHYECNECQVKLFDKDVDAHKANHLFNENETYRMLMNIDLSEIC